MEDYSLWERRKLSVDALKLDKRNPRLFADSVLNCSQSQLLHLLIDQSDVRDIAKRICKNGYFSFNIPVVVKERRSFVVLEGNRRLAALKLLRNPELSTVSTRRFFVNLSADFDRSSVEKIDTVIAPTRESADILLYTVHGSESARRWSRLMKQKFIAGKVASGESLSGIANKFNVAETAVKESVAEVLLLQMAMTLDFDVSVSESIQSEAFPLSTLLRIVGTATFKDITGFSLLESSFVTKLSETDFKQFMRHIFQDLATGNLDSRSLGDEKSRTEYLNNLKEQYVTSDGGAHWEYVPQRDEITDVVYEPRRRRPKQSRQYLIPDSDLLTLGHQKLDALIAEGKMMPLGTYKNSAGLLLRTIMHLAVCRIMEKKGFKDAIYEKGGKVKGLGELLGWLVKSDAVPMSDAFRDKMRRLSSRDNTEFMNIRTLHDYVHDNYQQPDKTALSNFWALIKEMLETID